MSSHNELRELMLICYADNMLSVGWRVKQIYIGIPTLVHGITYYSK